MNCKSARCFECTRMSIHIAGEGCIGANDWPSGESTDAGNAALFETNVLRPGTEQSGLAGTDARLHSSDTLGRVVMS